MSKKTASLVEDSIACKELDVGTTEYRVGVTGRKAMFETTVPVKVGGWYNAAKSQLLFDTSGVGEVTGAASAHNAELRMPNKAMAGGSYTAMECNLNCQTNTDFHNNLAMPTSLAKFKVGGVQTAIDKWEDDGSACAFEFQGLTGANGSVFATGGNAASNASLKIIIGGVAYYIMLTTTPSTV